MTFVILASSFILVFLVVGFNLIRWSEAYETFRRPKFVYCPEMRRESTIVISPGIAALTSVAAAPKLVIRTCGFWPERGNCDRECLKQVCHRIQL
jgi:hypothetical protein